MPTGRARSWCSPRCRQGAYRARHHTRIPVVAPAAVSRTATGVYECPGCGERLAGHRRCEQCNLFARRIGDGGSCHSCGEIITITELLNIE